MPKTWNTGDVLTAPDLNNYAGSMGLLSARRISLANADTTITDNNEHVLDTILNVAVGPGATINRAIEMFWSGAIQVTAASPFRVVVRAYYQAAATFTLASATNMNAATAQHNTSIDWFSNNWYANLAPGTYSFGVTAQLPINGATNFIVKLDNTSNYNRFMSVKDVGTGSLIGS